MPTKRKAKSDTTGAATALAMDSALPTRPRYEQARQAVELHIRDRNLQPGDRLPTEEALRREFGWSRVTITRALNELAWSGRVTRIQGSGTYVADPAAAASAPLDGAAVDGKRETLRLLISAQPYYEQDNYCAPLFAGIREAAAALGVDVAYHAKDGVLEPEVVERIRPDGILALPWRLDDLTRVLALQATGMPFVGLALRNRAHSLPLICSDNFGGVRKAVRHLLDAGHRRIACNTLNVQNSDIFERLSGFQYEMAEAGLPVDPSYLMVSQARRDVALLETWWRSLDPKPTALLMDGSEAAAMLSALSRAGVRIPEDLSVVLIDEVNALAFHTPRFTVLKQPIFEMGRRGVTKLVDIIRGADDRGPEILPTELVPGDSVVHIAETTSPVSDSEFPSTDS